MAIMAGRCWTHWLATMSAWYEPHREYVEWSETNLQETWPDLPPRKRCSLDPCVKTLGMKLPHLSVMCDL
jgi:hypothetical protein